MIKKNNLKRFASYLAINVVAIGIGSCQSTVQSEIKKKLPNELHGEYIKVVPNKWIPNLMQTNATLYAFATERKEKALEKYKAEFEPILQLNDIEAHYSLYDKYVKEKRDPLAEYVLLTHPHSALNPNAEIEQHGGLTPTLAIAAERGRPGIIRFMLEHLKHTNGPVSLNKRYTAHNTEYTVLLTIIICYGNMFPSLLPYANEKSLMGMLYNLRGEGDSIMNNIISEHIEALVTRLVDNGRLVQLIRKKDGGSKLLHAALLKDNVNVGTLSSLLAMGFIHNLDQCSLCNKNPKNFFYRVVDSSEILTHIIDNAEKWGLTTMSAASFFRKSLEEGIEEIEKCKEEESKTMQAARRLDTKTIETQPPGATSSKKMEEQKWLEALEAAERNLEKKERNMNILLNHIINLNIVSQ